MPEDARSAFLAAARVACDLLAVEEVVAAWDEPSALPDMTIRALAAHLSRAGLQLEVYLDGEVPAGAEVIDACQYYAGLSGLDDRGSALNVGVRDRAVAMAAAGHERVVADLRAAIDRLTPRLAAEPAHRLIAVIGGLVLTLDEYLKTRIVELVVHADDLAVSVGLATPPMPVAAVDFAIDLLVGVARVKHGDVAVLRALTRRERDDVDALRVF